MAEVIDRLELNNWLLVEINSEENDVSIPDPYPRPGMLEMEETPEKSKKWASPAEVAALFSGG